MRKLNIALGFYQNPTTAYDVVRGLKDNGIYRLATVHHKRDGLVVEQKYYPISNIVGAIITFFVFVAAIIFVENFLVKSALIFASSILSFLYLYELAYSTINAEVVNRFKNLVVVDEILVIVEVKPDDVNKTLAILRQVKSGHPITFLLRSEIFEDFDIVELPREPLSLEQSKQNAMNLATSLQSVQIKLTDEKLLLEKLNKTEEILHFLRHDVAQAEYIEQTITVSAEWLLDNMHVIEGSIDDVKRNLSKEFYAELPKLIDGQNAGLPRIYIIAVEIVNATAGRLTKENITQFVDNYQSVSPLTIGELWALPLMLRVRLLECIQYLTIQVDKRMYEGEQASFWGNRLMTAARREPNKLPLFLSELEIDQPNPAYHFAEELMEHLFDEESILLLLRSWLEQRFYRPIDDVILDEQKSEAADQVAFANSIISLITLSQLSWKDIFEDISPVDAVFRQDPIDCYQHMNFDTRNRYRARIEQIAKKSHLSEVELAKKILLLAQQSSEEVERHVGFYLIDDGRKRFEKSVNYKPNFAENVKNGITKYSSRIYLLSVSLLTILIETLVIFELANSSLSLVSSIFLALIALIPVSEIVIQFLHFVFARLLPPSILPKMSFETGIPSEYKTLVVVPTMLMNAEKVEEELFRLEIRYLANSEEPLIFALLTDFTDAPEKSLLSDDEILDVAKNGIANLDSKYGPDKFFLFHRQRVWSESENAWIGWERKRGKLHNLNCYLVGEKLEENIVYSGNPENLKGIKYVITLDSDTLLPKNKGRELVEVISHPLNTPRIAPNGKSVLRGYTIIQPRVTTGFSNVKSSWFSMIFAEASSVDPYSQVISNLYQDLTSEGTYHGKGIYDLKTFHCILYNRFPDEHLLSHDLIEGAFVRTAFASNICLYDQFPEDYLSWLIRQHRWMRGDFQIIDWIFSNVPTYDKKLEANSLKWLNRWQIFDNVRRALLPLSLLTLLLAGWWSPISIFFTALVTIVIFMPPLMMFLDKIVNVSVLKGFVSPRDLFLSLLRSVITTSVLPYEALYSLDAIIRVAYRRLVSRRNLLQWITFGYGNRAMRRSHIYFIIQLGCLTIFAILVYLLVVYAEPQDMLLALPFCILWAAAPVIVYIIDIPIEIRPDKSLSQNDKEFLRLIARQTWRYFDDFVGPETYWLPPDNYQTALKVEVAMRTSPTNIGLWLLSLMSAFNLRQITIDTVLERMKLTIQTLKKLERFEGHFLNWYNLENLGPLYPRYISAVDSGNLLACFWTLEQWLYEVVYNPIIDDSIIAGIFDIIKIVKREMRHHHQADVSEIIDQLEKIFAGKTDNVASFIEKIKCAQSVIKGKMEGKEKYLETVYWIQKLDQLLISCDTLISQYLLWVEILMKAKVNQLKQIDEQAENWRNQALKFNPSIDDLITGNFPAPLRNLITHSQKPELPDEVKSWGKILKDTLSNAGIKARERLIEIDAIIKDLQQFSNAMNMSYLYNRERKLFTIGYNVDDKKSDNSFYDLLASEARIASFVSIAKGDIPVENWWSLGRSYTVLYGRKVLLSWSGSMFEYLMPLIFNRPDPDTLLGKACFNSVACQIIYGNKRGIPWGISESAFSAIDSYKTYQYRSFGVPGLGLKRGLEKDLVVSPYSTALALAVDPAAALKNLRGLLKIHNEDFFSRYGYYESVDFTRQHTPKGERGVIVYAYMAHHQGMILTSINNLLNNEIIIRLFHADPRISGVEELLHERMPSEPPVKIKGVRHEIPRLKPFSLSPIMGVTETPQSVTPKVNVLSNGDYSVMVTNAGGGYSRWRDFDITRWTSDTTRDSRGNFIYIKDLHWNNSWSVAYQPTQTEPSNYSVNFKADKAEFKRRDYMIETLTEIAVSPEDNAEIWLVTFTNHSTKTRYLEITSYMELSMAAHAADRAHPCFNKLFIETEAVPEHSGLVAFRRPRSPEEHSIWVGHVFASSQVTDEVMKYETDRARFIGRNNSLKHPDALDGELSDTAGTVLDPIFSLRKRILLRPGARVQLSFVTVAADKRENVIALIEKYKDIQASHHTFSLSWSYAQLQLRHLRIHQEEVQLFQKLASRILYPHSQLRPSEDSLKSNRVGQSHLWIYGISGDLPMIVVTVGDIYDLEVVRQVLIAHTFMTMRGLKTDLIIINEESTGYEQPINQQLQRMIEAYAHRNLIDMPGGIYLRSNDKITSEDLNLILASARVVIVAARGTLRQQLVSPLPIANYPGLLLKSKTIKEVPSRPLPYLELPYFNGTGGFTADGKNYVIYLGPQTNTPLPWINVISNPQFGTLVTESGLGCTWYGNSQTNRLTPWSNDPVINPITDTLYIRDEELGVFWTPTASPVRELDAYRASHGQGYSRFEHNSHGIEQELLIFVPVDNNGGLPLRIQKLKLFNNSPRRRQLTITSYSELVLGANKEETQMHIITDWDPESQALFAYNRYNPDFGEYLAFSSTLSTVNSFTGDRTEFIGRNRSATNPEAMRRKGLSGRIGAGIDPCAALQIQVDIDPGKTAEVVFILGYASDTTNARKLIHECRKEGAIEKLFVDSQNWWDTMVENVQVEIPDLATKFFLNRWLPYQNLSCRFWGRTAFYQSSGAYGFRDQLQDAMALVYSKPGLAREQILRSAGRQFIEGDVQHWWHPQNGGGIRTRITDDLLWLPFVTAHYVRTTGDKSILNEKIPFLTAPLLLEGEHELYQVPLVSDEVGTLLEHCRRTLNKGITAGPHGLPLIGGGDWNDGMNRVGIQGKGESVWLGWFLIHVMNDFGYLLEISSSNPGVGDGYRTEAKRLAQIIEDTAWDGDWYRRAYFDDGTPLGTKDSTECMIDSIAQSWAVICGHGNPERIETALNSATKHLIKENYGLSLLLTPPFNILPLDPGYIKGYPPGVRENGGQYTHGSLWLPLAFVRKGDIERGIKILQMMQPTRHTINPEAVAHYKGEPYVLAGDVYDLYGQIGRCGWTWYTGSGAWMYRIWLEDILGFKLNGDILRIDCTIPSEWAGYKIIYKYKSSTYRINVQNPNHRSRLTKPYEIKLSDDGQTNNIDIVIS